MCGCELGSVRRSAGPHGSSEEDIGLDFDGFLNKNIDL
jgi:hypothetical protein